MSQQRQKAGLQLLSSKINEHFGITTTAEQLQTHGWLSWQRPGNRNNYFQNEKLALGPFINSPSVIRVIETAAKLGQKQDVVAMLGHHAHQVLQRDPALVAAPVAAAGDNDHDDADVEPDTLLSGGQLNGATLKQQLQQDGALQRDTDAQKDQGHHHQQQQAAEDQRAAAGTDGPAHMQQEPTSTDTLPSHLIWLPLDREQQGLATIADWLTKSMAKRSSTSFTAARLQQLGMRAVGAVDRGPGARNFVWWPGVLRERALKMHSYRHGADLLLGREDCRQALGITQNDISAAAATAAAAIVGKPSSGWANTAAAVNTAAAQRTSSSEPPLKRSRVVAVGTATAAGAAGGGQSWQPGAAVKLVGAAGEAASKAASAIEQLLAALEPVKPFVTWPPAAYNTLPQELRTGLPAAIANFIVAADNHITQLQRHKAALQQQAGRRQGHVRHYSLRQQGGDISSASVANGVLQAVDAAVGWLQGKEQQRLLQRAQQAQLLQLQAEERQVLSLIRGTKRQQQQQHLLHGHVSGVPASMCDVASEAAAAAAASSGVQLQVRGQSAEAQSVVMADQDASRVLSELLEDEDLVAVREKMRQLEAELAVLQQREAQLAAGGEQLW